MSKEKANVKLRGLFASMMWLPIVESDKLPRNTVVECIKANVSKDFLTVNLCASKVDDTHLSLLARCMHKNLTRVDLNFWMCPRLTGKGVEDLARQMPSKLKTLKLNFKLLGQRLIETPCACTQATVIMHNVRKNRRLFFGVAGGYDGFTSRSWDLQTRHAIESTRCFYRWCGVLYALVTSSGVPMSTTRLIQYSKRNTLKTVHGFGFACLLSVNPVSCSNC